MDRGSAVGSRIGTRASMSMVHSLHNYLSLLTPQEQMINCETWRKRS